MLSCERQRAERRIKIKSFYIRNMDRSLNRRYFIRYFITCQIYRCIINVTVVFSQRCRHADGGFWIPGRRQLVQQRGGKPAPNAPTLPGTSVCTSTSTRRRTATLAGTRAIFARWGKRERRRGERDGPMSSALSTVSFRLYVLQQPARPRSESRIAVKA